MGTSENNFLLPHVEMGVEARQTIEGPNGCEDAPITRPDHPVVKYATDFTHNFDLIAERKSVVFHLRELAKATVLAKFLVDSQVFLRDAWFDLANWDSVEARSVDSCMEIPELRNYRCHSLISV